MHFERLGQWGLYVHMKREEAGTGFGCRFTGTVTPKLALGRHGLKVSTFEGDLEATGCTEPAFNGTYAHARLRADAPGQLDVRMSNETDDGTTETEVQIRGTLTPLGG